METEHPFLKSSILRGLYWKFYPSDIAKMARGLNVVTNTAIQNRLYEHYNIYF
jgi:hypothetical protein